MSETEEKWIQLVWDDFPQDVAFSPKMKMKDFVMIVPFVIDYNGDFKKLAVTFGGELVQVDGRSTVGMHAFQEKINIKTLD